MNFTINAKLLRNALESVSKAVPSKANNPILGNFLFVGDGSYLTITGSDSNLTIKEEIPCETAGDAVIPLSLLELVKVLPDENVSIDVEDGACRVSWKNGNSTLPVFNVKDYPEIKTPDTERSISLSAEIFASAIAHTVQFTDADELRPALSGVFFNDKGEYIDIVASDSKVLAVYKIARELPDEPFSFIIPAAALNAVRNTIRGASEITIAADDTSILIKFGTTTIIARKIVGKFPNYESIMPKVFNATLTAKKAEFLDTFKRVSVCASKASGTLKLSLNAFSSTVESQDLSFNTSAKESPETFAYEGADITIGFRDEYLIKAVSAMEFDAVTIKLNDARKAVIIECENDPCTILLMPVQI